MKIVALDAEAMNPGDLSWTSLEELGDFRHFPSTKDADFFERAKDAEALIVNKVRLDKERLSSLPKLRYIGISATGFDNVDVHAAKELGITVTHVAGYATQAVAQMVFALWFELAREVSAHDRAIRRGGWTRASSFCFTLSPQRDLYGARLGVVGYGDIGRQVAKLGLAFGMEVLVFDKSWVEEEHVTQLPLDELLSRSDLVSLHLPLNPSTRHIIARPELAKMKREAMLINTARGGLVDNHALGVALEEGEIAGAGLDVVEGEPIDKGHPLLNAPRCRITPHIAWATRRTRATLLEMVSRQLHDFLAGAPLHTLT